jgi:glycosyltransferase involved in cell wall biosynthesis
MRPEPGSSLRILYHHRIAATDGMRVHIEEIVAALRARGHVVKVVGPDSAAPQVGHAPSRLEAKADALRRILPAAIFEVLELLYNIPVWRRLSREIDLFRPDILYERYNLFLLAGLYLRRRHRLPMMLEINAPIAMERERFGNLRLRRLARMCERTLWRQPDILLPVTEVLACDVRATRGTDAGVHVVPNGARLDMACAPEDVIAARTQLGLSGDEIVLGFAGFVRTWHGVGWALEALPDLPPNVHLLVVGDGPARGDLENRAAEIGINDRVHFTGRIPHDAMPAYMQLFDIALQTASVAYASPLKLFEYMALGLAIVAPDQPNIREILENGHNAILFDPAQRETFTAALARLCEDASLRAMLGVAARRTVEDVPMTWSHNAVRIETLARQLLHGTTATVRPAGAVPTSTEVPAL